MKKNLIIGALIVVAVAIMILSGNNKNQQPINNEAASSAETSGPIKVTGNVKPTFNPTTN